jgi:hypothetical protein
MTDQYRLVEEVPGVPISERYFVSKGFTKPIKHFATLQAARDWLYEQGVEDYQTEFFEP